MDIFTDGDEGIIGDISVYSKVKVRAKNGNVKVSNLEAPAVRIQTIGGDIELNSIKIANSILGESVYCNSETGNIAFNGRTVGDVKGHTKTGNLSAGTIQSLTIDLRAKNIEAESAYAG